MEYWLEQLSDSSKCYNDEMAFILIGNKSDVPDKECIAKESEVDKQIRNWCQQQQLLHNYLISYHKCSARTGEGV